MCGDDLYNCIRSARYVMSLHPCTCMDLHMTVSANVIVGPFIALIVKIMA